MKTEEQMRAYLDALHKDVQRMYAKGRMTVEYQKGLASIVATLLWALDDPLSSDAPEPYSRAVLEKFDATFGGAEKLGKYGAIFSTKKKFHPGEPVFLIRATDPLAYKLVQEYAERCMVAGCDAAHIKAAFDHAARIFDWQQQNPILVKKKPD